MLYNIYVKYTYIGNIISIVCNRACYIYSSSLKMQNAKCEMQIGSQLTWKLFAKIIIKPVEVHKSERTLKQENASRYLNCMCEALENEAIENVWSN